VTKRIFQAICLVALAVFVASVGLFMGVLYEHFSNVQKDQLEMQTTLAAQGAAHEGMAYFEGLLAQDYRITWIDADGTVLYDSLGDSAEMENHLEREEIQQAMTQGMGTSSRRSETLMERAIYCAKQLPDGTVLRLSMSQHTLLTLFLGMLQPICMIFALALALALWLAYGLSKKIVQPLNTLNLDEPMANQDYEEIRPLLSRLAIQQNQIRENEQVRREFTANVSHELKTPLQTISGCAELLANGVVKPEDVPRFSKEIYDQSQRMIQLVEDIIKLSHLDEGAGALERTDTDLYALAQQTVESLRSVAQAAQVTLTLTGAPARMKGVDQLLSGIVYNLCDNAIKYNRPGGTVVVRVQDGPETVTLQVADTGIGIPQKYQERIFERFFRVDKSHSRAIGGTGLGLSIVKHAARLHNASIDLESQEDKGTTVTVTFPKY
jgi:two-component system phosphate regulon sensor histidine kinase PhoR